MLPNARKMTFLFKEFYFETATKHWNGCHFFTMVMRLHARFRTQRDMYIYIYMYMCINIDIYIYICVYIYIHILFISFDHVYIYIHIFTCVGFFIQHVVYIRSIRNHICIYVCICICNIYIYMYVCVYYYIKELLSWNPGRNIRTTKRGWRKAQLNLLRWPSHQWKHRRKFQNPKVLCLMDLLKDLSHHSLLWSHLLLLPNPLRTRKLLAMWSCMDLLIQLMVLHQRKRLLIQLMVQRQWLLELVPWHSSCCWTRECSYHARRRSNSAWGKSSSSPCHGTWRAPWSDLGACRVGGAFEESWCEAPDSEPRGA